METKNKIKLLNDEISELSEKINDIIEENKKLENSTLLINNNINELNIKINKFIEQENKKKLYSEYENCLNRDGIPTYLLKKSIDIINNKIRDLLSQVDFDVYFNDNLQLKMIDMGSEINIIEGSGSERTFTSVMLKIALRSINTKSKPNCIFYDEIFGKLKGKYVNLMKEMLNSIKNDIDKVIIIEHKEKIDYDYMIDVVRNENGISKLSFE